MCVCVCMFPYQKKSASQDLAELRRLSDDATRLRQQQVCTVSRCHTNCVCVRVCVRERVSECVRERERERAKVHSFGVRDAQALSDEEISFTFLQEKSLKY